MSQTFHYFAEAVTRRREGFTDKRRWMRRMVSHLAVFALTLLGPIVSLAQTRGERLMDLAWQEGAKVTLTEYYRSCAKPPNAEDQQVLASVADFIKNVGRRDDAIQLSQELLRLQPNEVKYHMALAEAYLVSANLNGALQAYRQGLSLLPTDTSTDDQERGRVRRVLTRRIHFLEQAERYEGYNGAYELAGQVVIFKFDPYLGTFPQVIDLRTGLDRILIPVAPAQFSYGEQGGMPGGEVRLLQPTGSDKPVLEWQPRGQQARSFVRITRSVPVSFKSGEYTLSGTLHLPIASRPMAAVVLAQGSGPSTRFSIGIEAMALAEAGAVALIFDKRGTGRSEGPPWHSLGLEAQAADVTAGVEFLHGHELTKSLPIGVWGFSQGGWVVPLVATRSANVAFVMLAAGPAVSLTDQTAQAVEYEMRTAGHTEAEIKAATQFQRDYFTAMGAGKNVQELQAIPLPEGSRAWRQFIQRPQFQFEVNWWRSNLYDPAPVLEQLKVPVLALYGALDHAVPPRENVPRLSQLLAHAPTRDYTITILPKTNHLFMEATTGSRREFGQLGWYSPAYFRAMRDWLRSHFLREEDATPRK